MTTRSFAIIALLTSLLVSCGDDTDAVTFSDESQSLPSSTASTTRAPKTTTTTQATTTSTLSAADREAQQIERDADAIVAIYRDTSDASFSGVEAIYESFARHNYPGEGCTVDDYRSSLDWPEDTEVEYIVLRETIERDPGWTIPGGPLDGEVPDGRIYIFQVIVSDDFPDQAPSERRSEVHATVLDGQAYFFIECF